MHEVPYGFCHCGCGERTGIARQDNPRWGYVRGRHVRYRPGHSMRGAVRKPLDTMYVEENHGHKTPCWIWQGGQTGNGYGRTKHDGRMQAAHRVFLARAGIVVPPDMQVDHLCRVRLCVNPAHLEPVTPAENSRRAARLTASDVAAIRGARDFALAADPLTARGTPRKRVRGGVELRERLAREYGVRADYIKAIWRGDTWAA